MWEISINSGAWTSLASLGASVAERRLVSRGVDQVALSLPTLDYASASPFGIDQPVAIRRDGSGWFSGRCTQPADRAASGTDHAIRAEISGPWWDLEHLPFLQTWQSYDPGGDPAATTGSHSRVQLGVSDGASRLNTMEVIADAIAAAVSLGAVIAPPLSYPPGLYVPVISGRDMSCADVVLAMLRWHPDVTTSIDYTTTPPRLQLHPRSSASTITRSAADHQLAAHQIRPRHDLQVSGVLIRWEQSVQDPDGNSRLRLVEDRWPAEHATGFRTLVYTMVVDGGALDPSSLDNQPAGQTRPPGATPHRQRIKTRPIPVPAAVDEAAKKWWINRIPVLAHYASEIDLEDIIIPAAAGGDEEEGTDFIPHDVQIVQDGEAEPPPWQLPDADNAVAEAEADIELYPRELVSGELPEWRNDLRAIPMSAEVTVAMRKSSLDELPGRKGQRLRRLFAREVTIGGIECGAISLTTQFIGTNAMTRVYRGIASFDGSVPDPGEPPAAPIAPPTGDAPGALAKPLYEARSTLQWEGSWVELFDELPSVPWTSRVLNIDDPARTEWATMRAQIVEAVEDVAAGRLTLTLGLHAHLGPQDLETLRSLAREHQRPETAPAHPGPVLAEMRFDSQAQPETAETAPVLGARETPRRSTQGETSRPAADPCPKWKFRAYPETEPQQLLIASPGTVGDIEPESDSTSLHADPPPTVTIPTGAATYVVWLRWEWEPARAEVSAGEWEMDADMSGTLVEPIDVIVTEIGSPPTNQTPAINGSTGAVTQNGIYHRRLGVVTRATASSPLTNMASDICASLDWRICAGEIVLWPKG